MSRLPAKALQVRKGKVWSPWRTEKEEQSVGASLVYAAADEVPSVVLSLLLSLLAVLVQRDKYCAQKDEKRMCPEPLPRSSSVRTQWCLGHEN